MTGWGGRRVMADRAWWRAWLAQHPEYRCPLCDRPVEAGDAWDIDHARARVHGGSLGRANQRPAHAACNRQSGGGLSSQGARRVRPWHK